MTLPAPPNLTTLQPSAELWRLLADGPKENIETIRQSPALKAECERSHRQLSILTEGCGADLIAKALAPLVLVFGLGEQATAKAFWQVYTEALSDIPRMALDRAVAEWPRVGKFFPKPAEVRELALPHARALRQAAYRAGKALVEEPKPEPVIADGPSKEQIDAVMAPFLAQMADMDPFAKMKLKQRPTPSAKVDETGISAEARALRHRQQQGLGA